MPKVQTDENIKVNDSEKTIFISVVVPVYNVEKYLERCVKSVVRQTYTDWELILVDDGSPDRCPEMCDEYSKKDSRIKVIHQENAGLSNARNAGIREAQGTYLIFLDSDDWMTKNALNTISKLSLDDVDLCFNDYIERYGEKKTYKKAFKQDKIDFARDGFYSKSKLELAINDLYIDRDCKATIGYSWSVIYRTSFLKKNKILFPRDTALIEDKAFLLKCIAYTDKIHYESIACTNYYVNEGSLSTMSYDGKTEYVLDVFEKLRAYISEFSSNLQDSDVSAHFDNVVLRSLIWRVADSSDKKLIAMGHEYCQRLAAGIREKKCKGLNLSGKVIVYLSSKGRFAITEFLIRKWKRYKAYKKIR
jgi:glycosyltransferase involved in cell wall biosynthesis